MARINHRLVFGAGFSLLLHMLVLYSLAGMLAPKGQASGSSNMTVHLLPRPTRQDVAVEEVKPELVSMAQADFKVPMPEQPTKETMPQEPVAEAMPDAGAPALQTADNSLAAPPPAGSPGGTGFFPRAISLPWASGLQVRPVDQARPPVADYRKMTQMRAEQQAAQHAQEVLRQLNESLGGRLVKDDSQVKGSCELGQDHSAALVCKPKRLAKLLHGYEAGIVEALHALHKAENARDDFYIEFNAGRLTIATREKIQPAKSAP